MKWLAQSCSGSVPRPVKSALLFAVIWLGCSFERAGAQTAPPRLWELKLPSMCNSSVAVGPNGDLFFGNFQGDLWAVGSNGARKWEFSTGTEIWSSPAVAEDGTVYFGCRDRRLYAVAADGRKKWQFKTGGWVDASPALGREGTIYFGSWDNFFYAVNRSGREVWRFETKEPIVSSAAIGTNGLIYFGSQDGKLYALAADGRAVWSFQTGGAILSSPALDGEQRVFITSVDGYLYALDREGKLRWKLRTGSRNLGSPVLGFDGKIFIALNDEVWAVTSDGKRAWTGAKDEVNSTPLVAANGTVFFVTEHGQMQGCDHDRSLGSLWSEGVPYNAVCSPNLGAPGHVYVLGHWLLCAYECKVPLAPTPWPKFRGNGRNTGNQADWLK